MTNSSNQRGVALLVVLAALLLTSIALLGSLQVGWLAERRVASEGDTQRAFAAAEALVRDAELDILGLRADGTPCDSASAGLPPCRSGVGDGAFFPKTDEDLDLLRTRLMPGHRLCRQGICLPDAADALKDAWTSDLLAMTAGTAESAIAATYGQFTGAVSGDDGNPLLKAATPHAWYWVEVFRYAQAGGIVEAAADLPVPDRRHPFVYRITAYVKGLKPGTRVHLRSLFVPHPQNPPS